MADNEYRRDRTSLLIYLLTASATLVGSLGIVLWNNLSNQVDKLSGISSQHGEHLRELQVKDSGRDRDLARFEAAQARLEAKIDVLLQSRPVPPFPNGIAP